MHSVIKHFLIFTFFLSLSLSFVAVPLSASAGILPEPTGVGGNACANQENGECNSGNYSLNDFAQLFVNISNWILGIVGSLALLMFVYGGVTLIFSAGNNEIVSRGKQILLNSIIGLVIVFTSYIIIQFAASALLPGHPNIFQSGWFKEDIEESVK